MKVARQGEVWISTGADFAVTLTVWDTSTQAAVTTASGGTFTLYDEDGAEVLSESVSNASTTWTATSSTTPSVGQVYRGVWSGLADADEDLESYEFDYYVTARPLYNPIRSTDVLALDPDYLSAYPASQTSWQAQIDQATEVVTRHLLTRTALGRGSAWATAHLWSLYLHKSAELAYRTQISIPGGRADTMAAFHLDQYLDQLDRLTFELDEDGDGDLDTPRVPARDDGLTVRPR